MADQQPTGARLRPHATPAALIVAAATLVIIALNAGAFWLSYEHLHDVAAANGLTGARAWAWPSTVDLFIVAGELLVLRASLSHTVDPWAIALTAVGSLGSIALNVAGVGTDASPLEYVVAAVPPTASLIAFGALMRQVLDALRAGQPTVLPEPTGPSTQHDTNHDEPSTDEQDETGRFLTTSEVAERYGVSTSTVNTWRTRGRITPALRDPQVGNLYDPETLPAVAAAG